MDYVPSLHWLENNIITIVTIIIYDHKYFCGIYLCHVYHFTVNSNFCCNVNLFYPAAVLRKSLNVILGVCCFLHTRYGPHKFTEMVG